MSRKKIFDEYTDLPVSRQRKWQLRHPEKQAVLTARFRASKKARYLYYKELVSSQKEKNSANSTG